MRYALENRVEGQRLEQQSKSPHFDYSQELRFLDFSKKTGTILDAGSGSGIVTRYLANEFPHCQVVGCDGSKERTEFARAQAAQRFSNLDFMTSDISELSLEDESLDLIVSRFVLEHMTPEVCLKTLKEFHRCLKPGGEVYLIDIDGIYFNIFPQPEIVQKVLGLWQACPRVDMFIGRKFPFYLTQTQFVDIDWNVDTIALKGDLLEKEIVLMKDRLEHNHPFFTELVNGDEGMAREFEKEYLKAMSAPGSTVFFSKFMVQAKKPAQSGKLSVISG